MSSLGSSSSIPGVPPPGSPARSNGSGFRLVGRAEGVPPTSIAGSAPGYVTSERVLNALRERRRVRRMLRDIHEGKWRRVLIDMQVSQYAWPKLQRHSGKIAELLTKVNLVRLAWTMHATVLVGNMPTVSVPDGFEGHRDFLASLERYNQLDALVLNIARTFNVEAEAAVRVDFFGDRVVLHLDDNDCTLPVGPDGPDTQPTVWERRWIIERPDPVNRRKARKFLRVERHRLLQGRAVIEQEAYKTDRDDVLLALETLTRVDLETAGVVGVEEIIDTGASRPLITRFVQDYFNGSPQFSIQENDLDLLDTVTAAMSRLSRTHAVHARPKVRVPEGMIDRATNQADLTQDAFIDPEKQFEYITLDAKLEPMLEFMDRMVTHLLTMLEMSPAVIGHKAGGGSAPDSYDKLRLEATPTIARGKRSAAYFGPALELALKTASEIDTALPLRGYAVGSISVRVKPQLPKDDLDLSRELAEMRRESLIDHRSALAQLHGEDRADDMLEAIEADEARKAAHQQAALFGAVGVGAGEGGDG